MIFFYNNYLNIKIKTAWQINEDSFFINSPNKYYFLRKKKFLFNNNIFLKKKTTIIQKQLKTNQTSRKKLAMFIKFFEKNSIFNKKSIYKKYLTQLFLFFLLSHDVKLFTQKLVFILFKLSKSQLLRLIRVLNLLNNKEYFALFSFFKISGMYIKISGKFNGFGGAKKLRKHVILHKIKFNDKNISVRRAIGVVRHKVGTTTWSVFSSFK